MLTQCNIPEKSVPVPSLCAAAPRSRMAKYVAQLTQWGPTAGQTIASLMRILLHTNGTAAPNT